MSSILTNTAIRHLFITSREINACRCSPTNRQWIMRANMLCTGRPFFSELRDIGEPFYWITRTSSGNLLSDLSQTNPSVILSRNLSCECSLLEKNKKETVTKIVLQASEEYTEHSTQKTQRTRRSGQKKEQHLIEQLTASLQESSTSSTKKNFNVIRLNKIRLPLSAGTVTGKLKYLLQKLHINFQRPFN